MNYSEFYNKLENCKLTKYSIGKSEQGQDIYVFHVGRFSGAQIIVQAGIHAREYITSLIALKQAKMLKNFHKLKGGISFVPCVNPDGVRVVLDGYENLPENSRQICAKLNKDCRLFKANANLVDLNTNFSALWGLGEKNLHCKDTENFVGDFPESEKEVRALRDFTLKVRPKLTLSYHTKGEVIYYGFKTQPQKEILRDQKIGEILAKSCGYELVFSHNSCGGYKDFCNHTLHIPAYTIECGSDDLSHPIEEEYLNSIYDRVKDLPALALSQAKQET